MSFNPFDHRPLKIEETFRSWKSLAPKSYNEFHSDPYTRVRIILAGGAEFEAVRFSHNLHRTCTNTDIRRELSMARRVEQQQQKLLGSLKPIGEGQLEHTIGYEQLAVDLTAQMAKVEKDGYVKAALDFALLEDFDHLYRFADLLETDRGVLAERLVGSYTEIMPGRPTIAEHRYPKDDIKRNVNFKTADILTVLNANIITAAEQQTMNFYMNVGALYHNDAGRKLYSEIAMIEEQHVSHYGSLLDPNLTPLENLLVHEYVECYLYYSLMTDETDAEVRAVFEECLNDEIAHLHSAKTLLERYENKNWREIINADAFPQLLTLHENKNYVRDILKTVSLTAEKESYTDVSNVSRSSDFAKYQSIVNDDLSAVASHNVIESYIKKFGSDYRFQEQPHPIAALNDRKIDATQVARL